MFFELLERHGKVDADMAQDLFDALRNGPAHIFATKSITVRGKELRRIQVVVSWKQHQHLSRDAGDPVRLYVNLHTMRDDLEALFDRHRADIRRLTGAQRKLPRDLQTRRTTIAKPEACAGWLRLIST